MAKENVGLEFRLQEIYETIKYLLEEEQQNKMMSKGIKRHVGI